MSATCCSARLPLPRGGMRALPALRRRTLSRSSRQPRPHPGDHPGRRDAFRHRQRLPRRRPRGAGQSHGGHAVRRRACPVGPGRGSRWPGSCSSPRSSCPCSR
ncbi:MAG: hypothetical protein MZW92_49815 [Comamonadaceae bacterium]|nr:hypothetical protein [Comamonadaceae bacterium]